MLAVMGGRVPLKGLPPGANTITYSADAARATAESSAARGESKFRHRQSNEREEESNPNSRPAGGKFHHDEPPPVNHNSQHDIRIFR
jgi:hypothetical protein